MIVLGFFVSCNISKPITGNYGYPHYLDWGGKTKFCVAYEKISINDDNSFCYKCRTEAAGAGRRWAHGQWKQISKDSIFLTSTLLHDSVPIYVSEKRKRDITNKEIILSEEWSDWDLPIELIVNGKVINTTGSNRSVVLSDDDFPIIESICIRANANDFLCSELVNFTTISTITYNVKNADSNIFYISLPYNEKLCEFFYLKEIKDTLAIHRESLIYRNIKFKRTRR